MTHALKLLLVAALPLVAADTGRLRSCTSVEVSDIDNQRNEKGERIPPESLPELHTALQAGVVGLHLFQHVDDYTDAKAQAHNPDRVCQMRMKIIGYSGAQNNARVTAMVYFVDKETQKEVVQGKVTAQLHYDQGATTGALRKLVRSTADFIRDNW